MDMEKLLPLQRCLLEFIKDIIKYKDLVYHSALTDFQCDLILGIVDVVVMRLNQFKYVIEKRKESLNNAEKITKESK